VIFMKHSIWQQRLALCITALSLLIGSNVAHAQSFPNKPVRIIVPQPPGGVATVLARVIGQALSEKWGQPVIIDNKPGGETIIAAMETVKAAPDGYTLFQASIGTLALNPSLFSKLPYDAIRDFTHISYVSETSLGLYVLTTGGITSIADLIARAKANPESINIGSGDTTTRLGGELFARTAGVKLTSVPYKGGADMTRALLGGDIQVAVISTGTGAAFVKSGQLRILAVLGKQRVAIHPDVPTLHEAGLTNYEMAVWNGISGPSGIPKEIVNKINADFSSVLKLPDVRQKMLAVGVEPVGSSQDAYIERIRSDSAKFGALLKELGIRLD
jgi:tripartite-type tricarboxylate transporter receptor subunit TctC